LVAPSVSHSLQSFPVSFFFFFLENSDLDFTE